MRVYFPQGSNRSVVTNTNFPPQSSGGIGGLPPIGERMEYENFVTMEYEDFEDMDYEG